MRNVLWTCRSTHVAQLQQLSSQGRSQSRWRQHRLMHVGFLLRCYARGALRTSSAQADAGLLDLEADRGSFRESSPCVSAPPWPPYPHPGCTVVAGAVDHVVSRPAIAAASQISREGDQAEAVVLSPQQTGVRPARARRRRGFLQPDLAEETDALHEKPAAYPRIDHGGSEEGVAFANAHHSGLQLGPTGTRAIQALLGVNGGPDNHKALSVLGTARWDAVDPVVAQQADLMARCFSFPC